MVALVNQRLDYRNSTLVGIPAYIMRRLQSALNAAARLIFNLKRRRRRHGSHLRSPHRHRQRHRPQPEADSRLHVETTPESRPVDVRVRDPSEKHSSSLRH